MFLETRSCLICSASQTSDGCLVERLGRIDGWLFLKTGTLYDVWHNFHMDSGAKLNYGDYAGLWTKLDEHAISNRWPHLATLRFVHSSREFPLIFLNGAGMQTKFQPSAARTDCTVTSVCIEYVLPFLFRTPFFTSRSHLLVRTPKCLCRVIKTRDFSRFMNKPIRTLPSS